MCKYSPSNINTEVPDEIEFTAEVDADTELAVGTEVNNSHLSQFMCIYSSSTIVNHTVLGHVKLSLTCLLP